MRFVFWPVAFILLWEKQLADVSMFAPKHLPLTSPINLDLPMSYTFVLRLYFYELVADLLNYY